PRVRCGSVDLRAAARPSRPRPRRGRGAPRSTARAAARPAGGGAARVPLLRSPRAGSYARQRRGGTSRPAGLTPSAGVSTLLVEHTFVAAPPRQTHGGCMLTERQQQIWNFLVEYV